MILQNIKSATAYEWNKKVYISYYKESNKRKRFSTGLKFNAKNLAIIKKQVYALAQKHYEDNLPSDSKTLFKDVALEALRSTAGNRSKEVQDDYETLLRKSLMSAFGHLEIGHIRPMHIEKWKENLIATGLSKSRFHKYWGTLRLITSYLYKNEMIDKNPQDLVERKSNNFKEAPDNSARYYSKEEISAMLKHSTGWFRACLYTLFFTGIRTNECLSLMWKYVDFGNRKITIAHSYRNGELKSTKTGKIRVVDMSQVLYDELKIHYENRLSDTFCFPSYKTLKVYNGTQSVIKNHLKPLLKKLNIEYKTLYATRHSFASTLARDNVSLTYIQKMLGHSRISTTDLYTTPKSQDNAF